MNLKIKPMKTQKMLTAINKILVSFVLYIIMSCNSYGQDITGVWIFENQYINVELNLEESDSKVTGYHCLIYGAQGDFIDCSNNDKNTISGELKDGVYHINIDSEYIVDGVVKVSLKLDAGQLKWKLLSNTNSGELFFYPEGITLSKDN